MTAKFPLPELILKMTRMKSGKVMTDDLSQDQVLCSMFIGVAVLVLTKEQH